MEMSHKLKIKNYLLLSIVLLFGCGTFSAYAQKNAAKVDMSRLVFHNCKNECTAKKAVKKMKSFEMPKSKDGMKNPLGVNVCQEQLQGQLVFIKINNKERGVCQFEDGSSVELFGLHSESEKFIKP
jgi:hypothetical protein